MDSLAPSSSVQITRSGLAISISPVVWIWPAVTSPGPVAVSARRFGPSPCIRIASCFTFRTRSVTSSRTPWMLLNSCSTPSMRMAVTAAPCSEDSSTRRSALPSVMPKPRSSGSATMVAVRSGSAPASTPSFSGRISERQFLSITSTLLSAPIPGRAPRWARAARHASSDAAALARAAAVVRDGRHVADGGDVEADRLQRTQRRFTARTRAAHHDFQRLHAVLAGLLAGILGGDLGGVGGRLAAPLEALAAGGRPGDGVALGVGDGDDGIVEGGEHVGHAGRNVLPFLLAGGAGAAL